MKCPRCSLIINDQFPECQGCGFHIDRLRLGPPPRREGFVNDFADLLPDDVQAEMEERLVRFHQTTGGELVLVTVTSSRGARPSEYVFWLFNHWQVGNEGHTGLMVLLSQKERRIECEVGYGWEPIASDIETGQVLDRDVVPLLQNGQIVQAVYTGVERLAALFEGAAPEGDQAQ